MAEEASGIRLSDSVATVNPDTPAVPPTAGVLHAVARSHPWAPHVLCTLAMVFYAFNYVVGRSIHETLPPVGLAFSRAAVAALIISPFVWRPFRRELPVLRRHWRLLLGIAVTQAVLGQSLMFAGLHSTEAINASLIASGQPVLIMLFAWMLVGDRVNKVQMLGVVLAIAGMLITVTRGDLTTLTAIDRAPGDLLIALAVVGWGFYAVFVKMAPPMDPFVLFFAFTMLGALLLLPAHLAEYAVTRRSILVFTPEAIGAILFVAIFAAILALGFLNTGIVHLGPGRASIYHYLAPIFTAFLAVPQLGESVHAYHVVGLALAALGVYLVNRRTRIAATPPIPS